ncbi:glycosyltransferase family 2 protein [Cryobacterium tepidiphilum]|uniref:Glycosyltransferase family 2 protein n=1 Tax=Cryobacterium tepidiphilum TaxID=2486026 RepID=A0A3M8LCT0_9MICO|nr:glycosyltransferase family 2 protein [Cryobacterium tepidiphilum]RNE62602.1 glycosyltransferase family 2 protein [Cryobacterium tepidiphilum]
MNELPISVLVQTKNEATGIRHCLESLGAFNEVIVVDSNSDDGTQLIARQLGATVVNFTWNGRYPKKKQWQLDNVRTANEWVLFLDADESPTAELVSELALQFCDGRSPAVVAFDIPLTYHFSGKRLRHGHRVFKRCLVRRDRNHFPEMDDLEIPGMGELEGHYQPTSRGPIGRTTARISHDDKDPIRTWFERHNRYSDWEAHVRAVPERRQSISAAKSRQGKLFDKVPFKPLIFFLYSYILRRGFLDGRAGLDYALALAMYYWQIALKLQELRSGEAAHGTPVQLLVSGNSK